MIDMEILQKENAELKQRNAILAQELSQLKKLIFGAKSERFISAEPPLPPQTLFTQEECTNEVPLENLSEQITYTREKPKRKQGGRMQLPDHLHREVKELFPDVDVTNMILIGRDVTEVLHSIPSKLFVERLERLKYKDPKTNKIHIAPLQSRIVPKCIASSELVADAQIQKYIDHNPYYRQLQILKRDAKVVISKSTFGNWSTQHINQIEPLYVAHQKQIAAYGYLQVDESPIKVQCEEVKGKTHLGYMWVSRCPQSNQVLFTYQRGRTIQAMLSHLNGFKGIIQTDGYQSYEHLEKNPDIILIACWAHTRRYFDQARDQDKERSEYVLKKIQSLYTIEEHARENKFNAEQRQNYRQEFAIPILNQIREYIDVNVDHVLPSTAIGKAMAYTIKRWAKLVAYTNYGIAEIDNNLVENSIRPLALGRKNYLFAGSHESAQRSAIMYSFLGTCKIMEINPREWLSSVYNRIMEHPINAIDELLPVNFIFE